MDEHRALAITSGARMIGISAVALAQTTDLRCVRVLERCRQQEPPLLIKLLERNCKQKKDGLSRPVCQAPHADNYVGIIPRLSKSTKFRGKS
jgi:hypothetical protein